MFTDIHILYVYWSVLYVIVRQPVENSIISIIYSRIENSNYPYDYEILRILPALKKILLVCNFTANDLFQCKNT